jgi:hypothetical protein
VRLNLEPTATAYTLNADAAGLEPDGVHFTRWSKHLMPNQYSSHHGVVKVRLTCHVCGTPFEVHPYRVKSARFCSPTCRAIGVMGARPGSLRENRKCLHCGRLFWCWPCDIARGFGKFCSRRCGAQARSARWRERFAARLGAYVPAPPEKACLGPCRLWLGDHDEEGYAILPRQGVSTRATHSAWEFYTGARVPRGMVMMHWCNVPGCLAEGHIAPGSPLLNMRQKVRDGRHR